MTLQKGHLKHVEKDYTLTRIHPDNKKNLMTVTYFELRSETLDGDHPNTTEKPVNNTRLANVY
jgi:hypothetical protein